MKLTKTANTKIKPGMTLIEITVVILVLLTLISVLFIGANIYKKGADRAACILNIRNVHQAVRAHQNLNGQNIGDTLDYSAVIYATDAAENYLTEPECPTDGSGYTNTGDFPDVGTPAVVCTKYGAEYDATAPGAVEGGDASFNHTPDNVRGW